MRGRKNPPEPGVLLTMPQVCELLQFASRTVCRWVSQGRFPAPLAFGADAQRGPKRWLQSEVHAWIAARAADRRGSP